jgi:hypothetical protein
LVRKLKILRSLDPADRRLLREALLLPGFIWLSFRCIGVPRTQSLLRRWAGAGEVSPLAASAIIRRASRAQGIVKRNTGIGGNCLVRSLTLWTMLLRRGVPTDLRVGFRRRDREIQGHAWLEYAHAPINEALSEALSYVPYDKPISFDLWRQMRRTQPGENSATWRIRKE